MCGNFRWVPKKTARTAREPNNPMPLDTTKLWELAKLKDAGLLTQQEFASEKAKLLAWSVEQGMNTLDGQVDGQHAAAPSSATSPAHEAEPAPAPLVAASGGSVQHIAPE